MKEREKHLRAAFSIAEARTAPTAAMIPLAAKVDPGAEPPDLGRTADDGLFWKVVEAEFGFLRIVAATGRAPSAEDQDKWADLLSWMISEMTSWSPEKDAGRRKFRSLLLLTLWMDWDEAFWPELPEKIGANEAFMSALSEYVRSVRIEMRPQAGPTPISSRETIESLIQADAAGDWSTLGRTYDLFDLDHSDPVLSQAVRFLRRFDLPRLVLATNEVRQSPVAATIAQAMGSEDAFTLGAGSTSLHQKFACVFQTLHHHGEPLGPTAQKALTRLLVQISADVPVWKAWMEVFNTYPVRFPSLQVPLGDALAAAPESAIVAYVEAPVLHASPGEERRLIAECLRTFREAADPEALRVLWTAAYRRWTSWNFNISGHDPYLFEISRSALDFAVVGYIVEYMANAECDGQIEAIFKKIDVVDRDWHASLSNCLSGLNRLQSRLQPFVHAQHCRSEGGDWLEEGPYHAAAVTEGKAYYKMKYDLH